MTFDTALQYEADVAAAIADEYRALADLLEASDPAVWDAPSLCEGWRTREVVAHMTMPARYSGPAFMAELEAAGGDFTRPVEHGGGKGRRARRSVARQRPARRGVARLATPGGGVEGALTHCVIHGLDIMEAVPLDRRVPVERITRVLAIVARPGVPNLFGVDLSGVGLQADDLDWSFGSGAALHRAGTGTGGRGLWPPAAGGPVGRGGGGALHALGAGAAAGVTGSAGRRTCPARCARRRTRRRGRRLG